MHKLPPPVRDHELDRLGRDLLGRRDEVALVLPVFIVDDDDDPPFPQGLERVVDLREFIVHGGFLFWSRFSWWRNMPRRWRRDGLLRPIDSIRIRRPMPTASHHSRASGPTAPARHTLCGTREHPCKPTRAVRPVIVQGHRLGTASAPRGPRVMALDRSRAEPPAYHLA